MARINRDPVEQERLRRLYEQQQTIKDAGNPREEEAVAKLQQQALLKEDKEQQQQQQATDLDAVSRASSADSISKVCKVRVPDWINQDADPNMVFSFVYKVLMHHGEQRQEDGVRIALANRPELDRDTMLRVARAHEALGEVLR